MAVKSKRTAAKARRPAKRSTAAKKSTVRRRSQEDVYRTAARSLAAAARKAQRAARAAGVDLDNSTEAQLVSRRARAAGGALKRLGAVKIGPGADARRARKAARDAVAALKRAGSATGALLRAAAKVGGERARELARSRQVGGLRTSARKATGKLRSDVVKRATSAWRRAERSAKAGARKLRARVSRKK